MEAYDHRAMRLQWDAERRLLFAEYKPGGPLDGAAARDLLAKLEEWRVADEPFGLLCNVRGLREVRPEFRAVAGDWFRRRRDRVHVAVVDAGPFIRVMVRMFRLGTGADLRTFDAEAEGVAWLASVVPGVRRRAA